MRKNHNTRYLPSGKVQAYRRTTLLDGISRLMTATADTPAEALNALARKIEAANEKIRMGSSYEIARNPLKKQIKVWLEENKTAISTTKGRAKREESYLTDENAVNCLLLCHPIAKKNVGIINVDDLRHWREWAQQKINPRTKRPYNATYLNRARLCLKDCLVRGGVLYNVSDVLPTFRRVHKPLSEDQILVNEEIGQVIEVCKGRHEEMADALIVQLTSGLRSGELLSMKPKYFDPEKGTYHVSNTMIGKNRDTISPDGRTKTDNSRRVIHLSKTACEILERHIAGKKADAPVFQTSNKTPISENNYRKYVKRLIYRTTGKNVCPHHLRSSFTTLAIDHADTLDELEAISAHLGHSDPTTAMKWYRAKLKNQETQSKKAMSIVEGLMS